MGGTRTNQERRTRDRDRRHINQAGVLELLDQIDKKHEDAHKRLRLDLTELEQRLDDGLRLLADKQVEANKSLATLAMTPLDITKMVLTPKIVIALIAATLTVTGAMWASNSGLRSDVRDILTRMESEQRVADANTKLVEANNATINRALESNARELKDSISAVSKRQELLTLQYNQLNDQLTKLTAQRER